MDQLHEKYKALKEYLLSLGSAAIAFSSGVDSTFLLYTAHEVLGDKAMAVTASSCSFPKREQKEAVEYCKQNGIRHFMVESRELELEGFRQNPPNRCYLCKHALFEELLETARANGIDEVCEGSNMDDLQDYRPGLQAIAELDIKSPLRHARLYKEEIRALSRELGLPTWDKPSFACLASRFVYGETISEEKLTMIDKAEQYLLDRGFPQLRVRIHGTIARIEVLPEDIPRLAEPGTAAEVSRYLRTLGFTYVTLDLQGYRTGSMNETLNQSVRSSGASKETLI